MSVCVALCAAVAVWLWLPANRGTAKLRPRRGTRVPVWLQAVEGAPSVRVRTVAAGGVVVAALAAGRGWWVAGVTGIVVGVVVWWGLGRLTGPAAQRRLDEVVRDLPQALDLLGAGLEAGLPLRTATAAVAEVFDGALAEELAGVAARVAVGMPEPEAWRAVADVGGMHEVACDVARSLGSGTTLAPTLRRHAADARAAHLAAVEKKAKAVGVSSVWPLMVCFLPAFMLVGIVPVIAGIAMNFLR